MLCCLHVWCVCVYVCNAVTNICIDNCFNSSNHSDSNTLTFTQSLKGITKPKRHFTVVTGLAESVMQVYKRKLQIALNILNSIMSI